MKNYTAVTFGGLGPKTVSGQLLVRIPTERKKLSSVKDLLDYATEEIKTPIPALDDNVKHYHHNFIFSEFFLIA